MHGFGRTDVRGSAKSLKKLIRKCRLRGAGSLETRKRCSPPNRSITTFSRNLLWIEAGHETNQAISRTVGNREADSDLLVIHPPSVARAQETSHQRTAAASVSSIGRLRQSSFRVQIHNLRRPPGYILLLLSI
jgi:hypothetical protein